MTHARLALQEMGASRGEGNLAETAPKIKAFLDKVSRGVWLQAA